MFGLLFAAAGVAITATEVASAMITVGTVLCATQTIIDNVEVLVEG